MIFFFLPVMRGIRPEVTRAPATPQRWAPALWPIKWNKQIAEPVVLIK